MNPEQPEYSPPLPAHPARLQGCGGQVAIPAATRQRALSVVLTGLLISPIGCNRQANSTRPDPAGNPPPAGTTSTAQPQLTPLSNMVRIKAGEFLRIKFPVTISRDYWMSKYEVTQGEFASVLGYNPSHFKGDSNQPVEKVSFIEATRFCSAVTERERKTGRLPVTFEYRLPTEAEWEYACRAGSTNQYNFGEDVTVADQYAWTSENSDGTPHPVGQKRPNAWGLYDMHGNVWEWCNDWFAPYPPGHVTDPTGPPSSKYKVFKGGGWNQEIQYARCANRFMMSPSNGIHFVGFRLSLGPVPRTPPKP